jgi:predicted MPP superfamily phosphohydrolase
MNIKGKIMLVILSFAVVIFAYTVYDNKRIVVREQVVYIKNLPQEFDDFRILQISDLHGKRFGESQSELIAKVNSIEYDMIAFTGDMETTSKNLTPFLELLKGIDNNNYMFYVNGNDDIAYSSIAGNELAPGKKLEENGCILLTKPYPLNRAGSTIWISNYFTKAAIDKYKDKREIFLETEEEYASYKNYLAELETAFSKIKDNADIKIAVNHIPFTKNDFAQMEKDNILDFSLILAGHNHGGQIRIPFYGALFIPGTLAHGGIWFPDQKDVSGLNEYDGIQQYISAGLGASVIPFRLFDTPEINIIVLKTE